MSDSQQAAPTTEPTTDFDFDTWLGEQPEHVKKGYEGKTQGLHSALEKERDGRKKMSDEIKRLSGLADAGTATKTALDEMSTRLERAERQADFYREAGKGENLCSNPEAAFLVASAKDLFNKRGEPDWAAIKAAAPELFQRTKTPPGNAGSGNGSPPPVKGDMNAFIRAQTGRG